MIDRKVHSGFVRPPAEPNADDIKASVNEFLETNPVTPGASAEEAAQIKLNAENIEKLQTLSEGLDTVVISDSEPNTDNKCLWIQSGQYESFDIPQINDETVSEEDTWSSKKISDELNAQVSQLSEEIGTKTSALKSDIVKLNPLVDSYANYEKDKAIKNQSGLIEDEAGVCTSNFIEVQATHSLTVTSFSDATRGKFYIILYDADKNVIGYWTAMQNRTFTAKALTAYIRFSFVNGFAATIYDNTSKMMLYEASSRASDIDVINRRISGGLPVASVNPDVVVTGWMIKSNGMSQSYAQMTIRKYAVVPGRVYSIRTAELWQYQHGVYTPYTGEADRIGGTHSGDAVTVAPQGANFLVVNAAQNAEPSVYAVYPSIESAQANPLYGKKYIAAGDSYTAWSDATYIDSKYAGQNVTYDREIRIRYGMNGDNAGISGSTMAITKASHPDKTADDVVAFSNTRYTEIPADTDILTIAFGINDATKCNLGQLGDTENTTFYGAWHKVLTYYAQNRPETKVGIICFQRFDNGYYRAVLEIAKHYGVPLLDFFGGADTPIYVDGKSYDVDAGIKEARKEYWGGHAHSTETEETFRGKSYMLKVSDGNPGHPGYRAHIDEASIIAEFLKRL